MKAKTYLQILFSTALVVSTAVTTSSCGFFSSGEKRDNQAEVWGIPQNEIDLYKPFLDNFKSLPEEEKQNQIKAYKNLSTEDKRDIRDFFQFYSQLTPAQQADIQLDLTKVDLNDFESIREKLVLLRDFQKNAFMSWAERKAIFKQGLNCLKTSAYINKNNTGKGVITQTGIVEMVPNDFYIPENPKPLDGLVWLNGLERYLIDSGHMWDPGNIFFWDQDKVWTGWFINWGFAAHKELVIFMKFRSTVSKMSRWQTSQDGEVQFQLMAVDPQANCKIIGESEMKPYHAKWDRPWVFSWAMLPTKNSLQQFVDASQNPAKLPGIVMEFDTTIISAGSTVRGSNGGEREIIDIIAGYTTNPKNQVVAHQVQFDNFELQKLFLNYINKKHRLGLKSL